MSCKKGKDKRNFKREEDEDEEKEEDTRETYTEVSGPYDDIHKNNKSNKLLKEEVLM